MKLNIATTTLAIALAGAVLAAPAAYEESTELTRRDVDDIKSAIASLNTYRMKREEIPSYELVQREYQIVTDVLTLIKNTNLAPKVLKYLVSDSTLSSIATKTIVAAVKSGIVNINTLFKSLNDSGLLVLVIQDLIGDCSLYAEIYSLALGYISNLAEEINDKLKSKRELSYAEDLAEEGAIFARATDVSSSATSGVPDDSTLTELMESLKSSGLATQVVRQLIVDPDFLKWGADLIQQLFESKALTLGEVVDAIEQSGLISSLFKLIFNYDTLKTVVTNALAAAFGKCNDNASSAPTSTTYTSSPTKTSSPSNCKKRKRSYY